MGIQIRGAVLEDVPAILSELKKFSKDYGTQMPLFGSEDHSRLVIEQQIKDHVFFIAELNDELIGFISGYINPHPFNPEIKTLSETFWWVKPEARGSRAAFLLLEAFTAFGKESANWISLSLINGSPIKDSHLTRRGFQLQEKGFLMEVN